MMKVLAGRGMAALVLWASAVSVALASGDTGTGAVGEMDVGFGTLATLIAGIAGMCVVIWAITKLASKKKQ